MDGTKNWLEKLQKKAEEKLERDADPRVQKEIKKEKSRKMSQRTFKLLGWAKKGSEEYNKAAKKADEAAADLTEKTVEVVEKIKPLAETVDKAAESLGQKTKCFFKRVAKKVGDIKEDQARKPGTGSGILDILAPAVPDKDAIKSKAPKKDAPPAQP
ncbi:MAG: hypothetical protein HY052_09685 [Proteobacteria bacterium]|nr:hypothetical protein [Pseudomonadota bacterium]